MAISRAKTTARDVEHTIDIVTQILHLVGDRLISQKELEVEEFQFSNPHSVANSEFPHQTLDNGALRTVF